MIGSCVANAIAAALAYDMKKQRLKVFTPSRLFIYFLQRVIERTVYVDAGGQIRDGVKAVAKIGAPPEDLWPYDPEKYWETPPHAAFSDAHRGLLKSFFRLSYDLFQLRSCLAEQYPFVLGFTAYESFETRSVKNAGVVPMPKSNERMLGSHAVLAVGYDDSKRAFLVRNSWGPDWGDKGYGWMPYEYVITPHLAGDFWTLRSVVGKRTRR